MKRLDAPAHVDVPSFNLYYRSDKLIRQLNEAANGERRVIIVHTSRRRVPASYLSTYVHIHGSVMQDNPGFYIRLRTSHDICSLNM